ncbi:energy transducer TonB [Geofilum sp. OHC36d9]|uniref:energy transducer TonB n=1 Tax=Geofilum sp. OHC36d9 TaxID=3458413 RepID=UPI0040342E7C
MMRWRLFALMVLALMSVYGSELEAQCRRLIMNDMLQEVYNVNPADTSQKDGDYRLYYKSHLIEAGQYHRGRRVGKWVFFNLGKVMELVYDYDLDSLVEIAGRDRQAELSRESPCLFLGSSLVPYTFISSFGYPAEALDNNIQGTVKLLVFISSEGEIKKFSVEQSASPLLTEAVLNRCQKFPDDWRWLPRRINNKKVDGTYSITIYFNIEDESPVL